jgi:two-component system NtrC family sensor kinase
MDFISNYQTKYRIALTVLLAIAWAFSYSQETTKMSIGDTSFQINGEKVFYGMLDSDDELLDSFSSMSWVNFGNTKTLTLEEKDKLHVLKFTLQNNSQDSNWQITIPVPHLDKVSFYPNLEAGDTTRYLSGDLRSRRVRQIDDANHSFKVIIPSGEQRTYFITVRSDGSKVLPIVVESQKSFYSSVSRRNIFFGIFTGIMLIMFIYNLIVYAYTRDKNYLYYIFYVLFIFLAQSNLLGISYYFVGTVPYVNNVLLYLGSAVSGIFGCLFIRHFLKTYKLVPKLNFVLSIVIAAYVVLLLFTIAGLYNFSFLFITIAGLMVVVTFATISIKLSLAGERFAKIYLIAWTPIFVGLVFLILRDGGLLPYVDMINYMFPLGVVLETVMLSLALANQITVLKRDKETANQRVIEEVKKNEELVRNQNVILEEKVTLRTQELEDALNNLKSTQSQLVQSEKMASLGVLTAGIAHEINNPINFVTANVVPLRENIQDLSQLLAEYKGINKESLEAELARIGKLESELELEYMLKETDELINGIEEGAKRTHTIVDGLKTFSRGDAGTNSLADLNVGIISTLSVLKSRLNGVKVTKELSKDLPRLNCQIGKINQVFLNLINNALDALELENGPNSNESHVIIRSFSEEDKVFIQIVDDGNGISEEDQKKIFEPFFTTKPIGKGTGLGLSISYGIIEEHHGEMKLESEVGKGTTFTVVLPILT